MELLRHLADIENAFEHTHDTREHVQHASIPTWPKNESPRSTDWKNMTKK